jgi:hypothetical protein
MTARAREGTREMNSLIVGKAITGFGRFRILIRENVCFRQYFRREESYASLGRKELRVPCLSTFPRSAAHFGSMSRRWRKTRPGL